MVLRFLSNDEIAVRGAFDEAVFVDDVLAIQQTLKAAIDGKTGEFPFDDPRKPDERTNVIKTDRAMRFIGGEKTKTGVFKRLCLAAQV